MKISFDWLADYIDLSDISVEEIANKLTMTTAETEGIEKVQRSVKGLMIAEIIEAEKINKNYNVIVDCGRSQYRTICGAPNVRKGMKSVFAPAGNTVSRGGKITKRKQDGVMTEGILCSAGEIGMSDWHEAILECPLNIPNGAPLEDYITEIDYLIEVDNKSLTHRPDLWGHYGFAREIAAMFGKELFPLEQIELNAYSDLPRVNLEIEERAKCPCYCCIRFKMESNGPSPLTIQRRLHALGQRTINVIVDLTNYVMLDIGQPMHAFDGKKVKTIKVATCGEVAKFTPLDGQIRDMERDDLMIWDDQKPIAIAGIMGGAETEVSDSTKEVLLESASFIGSIVRRTALRLNLRTDASQRFEKDQPQAVTRIAIGRMLYLFGQSGSNVEVTSSLSIAGDLADDYRWIEFSHEFLSQKSGIEIDRGQVVEILTAIGFKVELNDRTIRCGIPSFRSVKDISLPVDILEEVLRIYGYDNITPQLPEITIDSVPDNFNLLVEHRLAKVLTASSNFIEVHTYSWYDSNWLKILDEYSVEPALTLKNPTAIHNAIMRKNLVPNLLEVLSRNTNRNDGIRIFEIGNIFKPDEDGNSKESKELSAIIFAHGKANRLQVYLELKGVLEKLGESIGLKFAFKKESANKEPWMSDGECVEVYALDLHVGTIGLLPKNLQKQVCPFGIAVWFTLDMEYIIKACPTQSVSYMSLPIYPGSTHDFSILWDKQKGYTQLADLLDQFSHPYIASRHFITYFENKDMSHKMISYTFRYLLQIEDRTLSANDIEAFRSTFILFLDKHGLRLN